MHIFLAGWCLFGHKPFSYCIQFQILSPYLENLFRCLHPRIWIPENFVLLLLMWRCDFKRKCSKWNRSSKKRLTILPSCWTSVCWGVPNIKLAEYLGGFVFEGEGGNFCSKYISQWLKYVECFWTIWRCRSKANLTVYLSSTDTIRSVD